jgi:hypothetical protein
MRIRTGLVLCLLLALGVAGCGGSKGGNGIASAGGSATPTSSAGAGTGNNQDTALKYSQCMRDNGVPKFPDPNANGGISLDGDQLGVSKDKVDAATQKCKQYLPNGGEPQKIDPQQLDKLRQYAKCMRENGVPKFPDPDENGGIALDPAKLGMDPVGPQIKAAEKVCQKLLGAGGGERSNNQQGGGNG